MNDVSCITTIFSRKSLFEDKPSIIANFFNAADINGSYESPQKLCLSDLVVWIQTNKQNIYELIKNYKCRVWLQRFYKIKELFEKIILYFPIL